MQCTRQVDKTSVQQRARLMASLLLITWNHAETVRHRCSLVTLWECDCKAEGISVLVRRAMTNKMCFCVDDAYLPSTAYTSFTRIHVSSSSPLQPTVPHTVRYNLNACSTRQGTVSTSAGRVAIGLLL